MFEVKVEKEGLKSIYVDNEVLVGEIHFNVVVFLVVEDCKDFVEKKSINKDESHKKI